MWFCFGKPQAVIAEWLLNGWIFVLFSPDHLRDLEVLQCTTMASQQMNGERIWEFSTGSRGCRFGAILTTGAPTRVSSRSSPVTRFITSSVRVGRALETIASLATMPPISVSFSVPVSSVFSSIWWLWHVSPSVWGLLIVSMLWWITSLSPAVMFMNPVLDDFWTMVWFQPQSCIKTLHCSWPTRFFRPALGLEGWDRGSQTGIK